MPLFTQNRKGVAYLIKYEDLCDTQSESGVVATIICTPEFINFSENLSGNDFTDVVNGILYDAIKKMYEESNILQIDVFNLATIINNTEILKSRAGNSLSNDILSEIIENSKFLARGTSEEYIMLVNNVMGMAYRRGLYRDLEKAQKSVLKINDITKLQKEISDSVDKTTENYVTGCEIQSIGEKIEEVWKDIEEKQATGGGYKIQCVPQLNQYVSIEKQELLVFLARMKQGKSMMLMNLAIDMIEQGANVLYFDTELSDVLFTQRLVSRIAQVEVSHIRTGRYLENEAERIKKAKEKIKTMPLYHKYAPVYNTDTVYALAKTMKRKKNIDTMIYDYLKPADNQNDAFSTYSSLGDLTNLLKNKIAGDMKLAVIAACQASRSGQVADSIRIAQYCSALIKMEKKTIDEYETDGANCGNYKIAVQLNRLGPQMDDDDYISAYFDGNVCTFRNSDQVVKENIF